MQPHIHILMGWLFVYYYYHKKKKPKTQRYFYNIMSLNIIWRELCCMSTRARGIHARSVN